MYHQLCRATGRLVAASHLQSPLLPVAPIALQRVEPPKIEYNTAHFANVAEPASSGKTNLIPGTNVPYGKLPESIKRKQELFQQDNDIPVFLKGGTFDLILYRFTMALCFVGLAGIANFVYTKANPKK